MMGASATGMVLTLLIVVDEADLADALEDATYAAREHPMRILALVPRGGRGKSRLDADIRIGGDNGPGEVAVLRMYGDLAHHAGSVAIPLLLSDTPVVAWWVSHPPEDLHADEIGLHSQRRITDSRMSGRELQSLRTRCDHYSPGDVDLAWTRLTNWRTILAATLDQPVGKITAAEISSPQSRSTSALLGAWLRCRLKVPVTIKRSRGPGITAIRLETANGEVALTRSDGATAKLHRPGKPVAHVALPVRGRGELLAEELRRLDPDEIYGESLANLDAVERSDGTPVMPQ